MGTVVIKKSIFPLSKVMQDFVTQTENQMRWNMQTQKIWPTEVYPGYARINAERKAKGQWFSTGRGEKSIRAKLVSADNVGDVTINISFLDYLRFADMGVGQGTKWEDVDSSRKFNYRNRYIRKWDRPEGSSHRPVFLPESRHLARRIQNYLADFYGYTEPINIIRNMKLTGVINI